jgi:hypothetical protein
VTYLIEVLGAVVVELDDTLLGSHISLNGDNLSTHLRFLSSDINLLSGRLEHILSTTIDDYLPSAELMSNTAWEAYLCPVEG